MTSTFFSPAGLHNNQKSAASRWTNVRCFSRSDRTCEGVEAERVGETESRHDVPAGAGRSVRVRPCHDGDGVQVEIISTRGNSIEAVTLDEAQLLGLIGALREAHAEAQRDLLVALEKAQTEAGERYRAALARNPWLNGEREAEKRARYIERPR